MLKTSQELYTAAKQIFTQATEAIGEYKPMLNRSTELNELVDLAYACRETEAFLDESRKNLRIVRELCEQAACQKFAIEIQTQDDGETNIKTGFCTATVTSSQMAPIPNRKTHPQEYAALLRFLNVPEQYINVDDKKDAHCPLALHWPGLVELVAQRAEQGLPLPPGMAGGKTYTQWKLKMLKRKEVDETL